MRMSYVKWFSQNEKAPEEFEIVLIKCDIFSDPTFGYLWQDKWYLSEKQLNEEMNKFPIEFKVEEWAKIPQQLNSQIIILDFFLYLYYNYYSK